MLKGKTAVITGGSRGIGAGIAVKFAAEGANVALIFSGNREKAEAVKEEMDASVKSGIYQCNVADFDFCRETVSKIIDDFGGIDILVNNAGITKDNLLITMSDEEFSDVINTNLKGCFNMTKACARNFVRRKYGKIINIASISGLCGIAGQANYSASKAGVIALTKVTAKEFAGKNICCNAIAPGFIETDMTRELQNRDEYIKTIPLRRAGTPKDVANLAAFLADDISGYITGEVIRIDGGLAM